LKRCKQCGKDFIPSKGNETRQIFCSRKCGDKWLIDHPKREPRTCKHCGKEYIPKASDRITYCSRECAFKDKAKRCKRCGKPIMGGIGDYCSEECKDVLKICTICGKEYYGHKLSTYCSDGCRKETARQKGMRYWKTNKAASLINDYIAKVCKECGSTFKANFMASAREYCSEVCARKHFKEGYKKQRKEQLKKAFVKPVYFSRIYKRDKGLCQICGKPVDYNKNPEDPRGATIDHVVPLSLGGKHHPDNCQLAHRRCNSIKGTKVEFKIEA